jgi:methyl-accepting chemotaxis protein
MDTSTQYIVNGIQQVAGAAEVQLHRSEESSRVIEEMTIGIQRIAEASSEVSEQTNHVSTRISIGNQDINELSNQINASKRCDAANKFKNKEFGRSSK